MTAGAGNSYISEYHMAGSAGSQKEGARCQFYGREKEKIRCGHAVLYIQYDTAADIADHMHH